MTDIKEERFIGSLLGTFVGDALGMPIEGWRQQKISSKFGEVTEMRGGKRGAKGRYTDDTQLMIGVAESLIDQRGFNGADMAERFVGNYDPQRGYGKGTVMALSSLREGKNWKNAGKGIYGEGSFGNGAAMRIAPVGVLFHHDPEELRTVAEHSAKITHAHPIGMDGAAIQAYAIAKALRWGITNKNLQKKKHSLIKELRAFSKTAKMEQTLENVSELLTENPSKKEVVRKLGNDSRVFRSVPTAIYSFLQSRTFEAAVIYAVNLVGDTDTIGAMTGAIAGAFYGSIAIPERWIHVLENGEKGKEYMSLLATKLYKLHQIFQKQEEKKVK